MAKAKKSKRRYTAQVLETQPLSPHMRRITFGGKGLRGFATHDLTDQYVKFEIPPPGADYQAPYDLDEIKRILPKKERPRSRSYTVRDWDPKRGRLIVDFFVHGKSGVGSAWAAAAESGNRIHLRGPRGRYRPDPAAEWHLMVGDEAAIPALAMQMFE